MADQGLIAYPDFEKVDMRVGRVEKIEDFPEANKPAYKLWINFGDDIGIKKTSAQITQNYSHEDLKGRLVIAVVNFPPKQIGKYMSEVLVLGLPDAAGNITLISPDNYTPLGGRVY